MSDRQAQLNRGQRQDMLLYLQNAHGTYISGGWGHIWNPTHGETRSTSEFTFHIGLMRTSEGEYHSAILVRLRGRHVPAHGTVVNWGASQPATLIEVLNNYKDMFDITPSTPTPHPEPEATAIPDWAYQVCRDNYGGYHYLDENGAYHACDANGNELDTVGG